MQAHLLHLAQQGSQDKHRFTVCAHPRAMLHTMLCGMLHPTLCVTVRIVPCCWSLVAACWLSSLCPLRHLGQQYRSLLL